MISNATLLNACIMPFLVLFLDGSEVAEAAAAATDTSSFALPVVCDSELFFVMFLQHPPLTNPRKYTASTIINPFFFSFRPVLMAIWNLESDQIPVSFPITGAWIFDHMSWSIQNVTISH